MMLSSRDELFEVIGRDPTKLIGVPETDWLDFKLEPYQLWLPEPRLAYYKFELAKDVSALANKDGGVIVIGVRTEKEAQSREDVAVELCPIQTDLVDPVQMKAVVREWTFPQLEIQVRPHAILDATGSLWTVAVERFRERDYPHIVTRNFIGEDHPPSSNFFGVFERSGSENVAFSPSQLQGWVQRGARGEEGSSVVYLDPNAPEDAESILSDDLSVVDYPEMSSCLILQASTTFGELRNFYQGVTDSLQQRFVSPRHHVRKNSGFDIPDWPSPTRTSTGALRIANVQGDSISVTRSGLATTLQCERHLTWAWERFSPADQVSINPLALVEYSLDFFRFFAMEVLSRSEGPRIYQWRVGMRGLLEGGSKLYLPRQADHFSDRETATKDSFISDWKTAETADAGLIAFQALAFVYAEFGYDSSLIPYSSGGRVDEAAIAQTGVG